MTPWNVPGFRAANGVSMDLSVGSVCITLSSVDNTGFSLHQNDQEGLDFDFSNFTGKLRIAPHHSAVTNALQDITSLEEKFEDAIDGSADNGDTENGPRDAALHPQEDLCSRLQSCLDQRGTETSHTVEPPETSELHVACARSNISIKELYMILKARPEAASLVDEQGRYPLHVFSENAVLLSSLVDYTREVQRFTVILLEAYPEALFRKDNEGNVPFVHLIQKWINEQYETSHQATSELVRTLQAQASAIKMQISASNSEEAENDLYLKKFPKVTIAPAVITSLHILSTFLERINDCSNTSREIQLRVRAALAEQIAVIPYLLKTLYLIEADGARHEVVHSPIIQRVFFCCESVGEWASSMLRHGGVDSKRAVDYLQDVSAVTATQYAGQTPTDKDNETYEQDRKLLFNALESSGRIVPSLTVLEEDEKERVATTDAVWTIINRSISRPLVIGIQSADFVFNMLLLLTFRYATETNNLVIVGSANVLSDRDADMLVLSLCFYFMWRKLSEFYSMLRISMRAFKSYNLDFWQLIDLSAIILATSAVFSKNDNAAFLALTVACLWLKFLSFLRAVNTHMALFISAVVEVSLLVYRVLAVVALGDSCVLGVC